MTGAVNDLPGDAGGAGPVRVQRRRARGWRMPHGAVYVGRPGRWGNPFPVAEHGPAVAVELYRAWLLEHPDLLAAARAELAGRPLACWCSLGTPCHADVLLDLANTSTSTSTSQVPRAAVLAGRALDTTGAPA